MEVFEVALHISFIYTITFIVEWQLSRFIFYMSIVSIEIGCWIYFFSSIFKFKHIYSVALWSVVLFVHQSITKFEVAWNVYAMIFYVFCNFFVIIIDYCICSKVKFFLGSLFYLENLFLNFVVLINQALYWY